MALGNGVEWMLTRLDIVIYVVVSLVLVTWCYRVVRNRYLDWQEDQQRWAEAQRQIAVRRQELEDGRRRLRASFEQSLAEAQLLEDRIYSAVDHLRGGRHGEDGRGRR
jgi:hypothetical protein